MCKKNIYGRYTVTFGDPTTAGKNLLVATFDQEIDAANLATQLNRTVELAIEAKENAVRG